MATPLGGTFEGTLVIDGAKLAELLRGRNGPVIRALIEAGDIVKAGARRRVGVYEPPDDYSRTHRTRKPGTLRDSIVKRVIVDGGGASVVVGSEDPIALLHHEGTVPHVIRPRRVFTVGSGGSASIGGVTKAGVPRKRPSSGDVKPFLVFVGSDGRLVRTRQVNHPGTKPNRYLTDSLADLRERLI